MIIEEVHREAYMHRVCTRSGWTAESEEFPEDYCEKDEVRVKVSAELDLEGADLDHICAELEQIRSDFYDEGVATVRMVHRSHSLRGGFRFEGYANPTEEEVREVIAKEKARLDLITQEQAKKHRQWERQKRKFARSRRNK